MIGFGKRKNKAKTVQAEQQGLPILLYAIARFANLKEQEDHNRAGMMQSSERLTPYADEMEMFQTLCNAKMYLVMHGTSSFPRKQAIELLDKGIRNMLEKVCEP